RMLFKLAGMKYDRMAAINQQHYHFIFLHEDGEGLQQVSRLFEEKCIPASVDEVFALKDVNQALKKVASRGSKGKTILKINR
ncbi:MAG: zinc-binding dehydrogenase, partial [Aeriscardovia sp.]|nr:zinc-binding dehydrogenase [Aeriscardovia sp.]